MYRSPRDYLFTPGPPAKALAYPNPQAYKGFLQESPADAKTSAVQPAISLPQFPGSPDGNGVVAQQSPEMDAYMQTYMQPPELPEAMPSYGPPTAYPEALIQQEEPMQPPPGPDRISQYTLLRHQWGRQGAL